MQKYLFVLLACLACACSSSKSVDNSTAEHSIGQPQAETNVLPSPTPKADDNTMNTLDNTIDTWIDTVKYGFVLPGSDEAAQIVEFAQGKAKYEMLVPRFKLGNLAFIEGKSGANAQDGNGEYGFCAVLLGSNMTFVELPNTKLMAKFITDLRTNPDALDLDKRIMFTMMMVQGVDYHLSKFDMEGRDFESMFGIVPVDPTWTDDGHTITIEYYQMKPQGMQVPTPQKCRVVIDESMKAAISCEEVGK
ncbi:MAG: hypothetical protein J6A01_07175 [Proteobacteria bacterium]|nr:hypothetical protein [Pseudomonadota bacterium]